MSNLLSKRHSVSFKSHWSCRPLTLSVPKLGRGNASAKDHAQHVFIMILFMIFHDVSIGFDVSFEMFQLQHGLNLLTASQFWPPFSPRLLWLASLNLSGLKRPLKRLSRAAQPQNPCHHPLPCSTSGHKPVTKVAEKLWREGA